jgi:hypothetical protein
MTRPGRTGLPRGRGRRRDGAQDATALRGKFEHNCAAIGWIGLAQDETCQLATIAQLDGAVVAQGETLYISSHDAAKSIADYTLSICKRGGFFDVCRILNGNGGGDLLYARDH